MPSDAQSMGAMCDVIAATEIPVVSQIADAASAGFSVYQGDYYEIAKTIEYAN